MVQLLTAVQRFVDDFILKGDPKATPTTLIGSRSVPASLVLQKRIVSCGAIATLVAAILRCKGFPVKLVHGSYHESSHAWVEVWDRQRQRWLPYDPMDATPVENFSRQHIKVAECRDWTEIRSLLSMEQQKYSLYPQTAI